MNQSLGLRMNSAMRVSTFRVRFIDVDGGTHDEERHITYDMHNKLRPLTRCSHYKHSSQEDVVKDVLLHLFIYVCEEISLIS
jgi:hypothetical protein